MHFIRVIFCLFVVQITCPTILTSERTLFAALNSMIDTVQHENHLLKAVQHYAIRRTAKLQVIKGVFQEWEKLHEQARSSLEKNKRDPVTKLKLIQRVTNYWPALRVTYLDKSPERMDLHQVYSKTFIPDVKDIRGFARLLMVNANIYRKKIEDMLNVSSPFISIDEFLELSYRIKHHNLGRDELDSLVKSSEIALHGFLELTNQSHGVPEIKLTENRWILLSNLTFQLYDQGYWKIGYGICKKILEVYPDDDEFIFKREQFANRLQGSNFKDRMDARNAMQSQENNLDERLFNHLCRRQGLILPPSPDLKCYYAHKNPLLRRIAGYKAEEVAHSPVIRIFHDVILEREIETLKSLAFPMLSVAKVYNPNAEIDISEDRISNNAWLMNPDHVPQGPEQAALYRTLNQRLEDCTGLNKRGTEGLQVNNYGIGGHYLWHYDSLYYNANSNGEYVDDRIATWMFYLNDVKEGGNTVFPRINISVPPMKGAAVFWYNFHQNGFNDYRTLHGGCPIIEGTKWVTNLWVRRYPQVFHAPCVEGGDKDSSSWEEFFENYKEE